MKKYLLRDWKNALQAADISDCVTDKCHACGVCDFETINLVTFQRVVDDDGDKIPTEMVGPAKHPKNKNLPILPLASRDAPVLSEEEIKVLSEKNRHVASTPTADLSVTKVRIRYTKLDTSVFLSHLEMMVSWLRALRRADAPVAYSGGFHPKPKVSLSPALPTGALSQAEFLDVEMRSAVDVEALRERLARHLPRGMKVLSVTELSKDAPNVQAGITAMKYEVHVDNSLVMDNAARLENALKAWHSGEGTVFMRDSKDGPPKPVDLRAGVESILQIGPRAVAFTIRTVEGKSPRPSEVMRGIPKLEEKELDRVRLEKVDVSFSPTSPSTQVAPSAATV